MPTSCPSSTKRASVPPQRISRSSGCAPTARMRIFFLLDGGTGMTIETPGSPLQASLSQLDRSKFDHVGLVTDEKKDGESWVEATRVWVTSPRAHPYNVEWLRFEPDSPVTGPLRTEPHVAYRTGDVARAIEGHAVLAEPFDLGDGFPKVAFVLVGGAVVEFMQYTNPGEEGWF